MIQCRECMVKLYCGWLVNKRRIEMQRTKVAQLSCLVSLRYALIDSDGCGQICLNPLEIIFGQNDVFVALMKEIFVLHTYLRPPMVHLTRAQMHRWCTVRCYFDGLFQVLSFHPLFICSLYLCAQILRCYKKVSGES